MRKWQTFLLWQLFFFSSFNTYLPMFVPHLKAERCLHAILSQFVHKGPTSLSQNSDKNCWHGMLVTLNSDCYKTYSDLNLKIVFFTL